jgi:hypothetical protein
VVALAAGSFILGWNLAPEPAAPTAAPAVTGPAAPFTEQGLASKRAGLVASYGPEFGQVVTAPAAVDTTDGVTFTRSGLDSKREALVARYGAEFGPVTAEANDQGVRIALIGEPLVHPGKRA